MNSKAARFFNAVALCKAHVHTSHAAASGWEFRKFTHPRTGHPMSIAQKNGEDWGDRPSPYDSSEQRAMLTVSAVRLGADAASIEVAAGISLAATSGSSAPARSAEEDARHLVLDDQGRTGLIYCYETAPATRNTCQIPVTWNMDGAAPDVERFRGIPRLGHRTEHIVFLHEQMTARWSEGVAPTPETALSAPGAFQAGDRAVMGIPWVHEYGELTVRFHVDTLAAALTHLKGLVTPAPGKD